MVKALQIIFGYQPTLLRKSNDLLRPMSPESTDTSSVLHSTVAKTLKITFGHRPTFLRISDDLQRPTSSCHRNQHGNLSSAIGQLFSGTLTASAANVELAPEATAINHWPTLLRNSDDRSVGALQLLLGYCPILNFFSGTVGKHPSLLREIDPILPKL